MSVTLEKKQSIPKRLRVGQRVRFGSAFNRREGVVIEDRGPLGVGGRQIIGIRYWVDYAGNGVLEAVETEVAVADAEVIPDWAETLMSEFTAIREQFSGWHRESSEDTKILAKEWFDDNDLKCRAEVKQVDSDRFLFKSIVTRGSQRMFSSGDAAHLATSLRQAESECVKLIPKIMRLTRFMDTK